MDRIFDVKTLKDWGLPYEAATPLEEIGDEAIAVVFEDDHYDSGRWSEYHALVFRAPDDGLLYSVLYSVGLTENQEERAWENNKTVNGERVEPFEVTKIAYRKYVPPGLDEDHDHALV